MPSYDLERALRAEGYAVVCGVDEAGRGPLCGPVVAAACILPDGLDIPELNDSKKLTPKKRDKLFDLIKENAIAYGIAEGSVEEINELNILEADLLAMRRAIDGLRTPDGTPYKTAIAEAGVQSNYTGENVATGHTSPQQVVSRLLKSEGHRANIVNEKFTRIGIGLEKNVGNRYGGYSWSQLFVK